MNRGVIAAAIAALVVGLGGGFLAARTLPPGLLGIGAPPAASGNVARASRTATPWNLFGRPRAANAPRRGIPRPEGFTVWRNRLVAAAALLQSLCGGVYAYDALARLHAFSAPKKYISGGVDRTRKSTRLSK